GRSEQYLHTSQTHRSQPRSSLPLVHKQLGRQSECYFAPMRTNVVHLCTTNGVFAPIIANVVHLCTTNGRLVVPPVRSYVVRSFQPSLMVGMTFFTLQCLIVSLLHNF